MVVGTIKPVCVLYPPLLLFLIIHFQCERHPMIKVHNIAVADSSTTTTMILLPSRFFLFFPNTVGSLLLTSTCQSRLSGRFVSFQTTLCEKCGDSFSMNPFIFLSDVTIVIISLMDTSKSFSNIQICNTNSTFPFCFLSPKIMSLRTFFGDMKLTAKYLKNDVSSFEVSGMKLEDL